MSGITFHTALLILTLITIRLARLTFTILRKIAHRALSSARLIKQIKASFTRQTILSTVARFTVKRANYRL